MFYSIVVSILIPSRCNIKLLNREQKTVSFTSRWCIGERRDKRWRVVTDFKWMFKKYW